MTGDPNTAPPPRRAVRARGRRRSREAAHRLAHARARATSPRPIPICVAAADDAAALLASLGHTVVDASPAALGEGDLMDQLQHGDDVVGARRARRDRRDRGPADHRRRRRADDLALLRGRAPASTAARTCTSLNELHRWTRRVVSWWLDDGFDLLLTPTLAEPPPLLGDIGRQDDGGAQRGRPARSRSPRTPRRSTSPANPRCRCRCTGATPACRSACSSSAHRSAKTC